MEERNQNNRFKQGAYLQKVNFPDDIKNHFDDRSLQLLADDVRAYLIDVISEIGNSHFSASLGVVELAVALHYVYDTPDDKLIWDVGHQAYAHKILTGRKEQFPTNRVYGGLSGFPKMSESKYDAFGTGHSSTSISAILGMYHAWNLLYNNQKRSFVAVIGDGAMTAGMAYEALNHAGDTNADITIILNDNDASIDPNVGALQKYLNQLRSNKKYRKWSSKNPGIAERIRKVKHNLWDESNFFESLGVQYYGPIDGHNTKELIWYMRHLQEQTGPKILHVRTKKGKGYQPAEEGDITTWHAPGIFNKETGEIIKITPKSHQPPKFQEVFGQTVVELAEKDEKICAVTPAMISGASLQYMQKAMPERLFDVAITEQHAVTFSAGLVAEGMKPFCHIYSTFLQRGYDQLIHDVAIQQLPVVFCLDRAGLVGADGTTHHGVFDLAYLRPVPNVVIAVPMHEHDLRNMMYTASSYDGGPFAIRFPRGKGSLVQWKNPMQKISVGKGVQLHKGQDIAILTIGHVGVMAAEAIEQLEADGFTIAHYDIRFLKPIDTRLLHEVCAGFEQIVTIEDGVISGGLGSAVMEFINDNQYSCHITRLGVPDHFIAHGTQEELYRECGFDTESIVKTVEKILGDRSTSQTKQQA